MAVSTEDIVAEMDLQQPRIRDVFLQLIRRIVDVATVAKIEALIVARRIQEIPALLRLGPQALSPLLEAIRRALTAGGEITANSINVPGAGAIVHFDMRNTAVENWLRDHGAELVKQVTDDQIAAIRLAIQKGIEAGRNPRNIALDIVGRIDKVTGHRVGGIVGLTEQQAQFIANARAELEALDPTYFDRVLRDKRFDGLIRKAIEKGDPLSQADIDKIIARYADTMLRHRGENIARTEALSAFNAGRDLAMQQAIQDGTMSAQNVTKIWETAHDPRVRESHREMQGQSVGINGVFISGLGARMQYPGDSSMGAGAADVMNCRCIARYKVDWLAEGLGSGGA